MAELQQSVVTDQDTRHQIQTQILQWEENLERLHCEQFRLRCYMASLQGGELPNPKVSSSLSYVSLHTVGLKTATCNHSVLGLPTWERMLVILFSEKKSYFFVVVGISCILNISIFHRGVIVVRWGFDYTRKHCSHLLCSSFFYSCFSAVAAYTCV